jgi:hypothetical protein
MDSEQFDRLARALRRSASRRRVMAGLSGGLLAGLPAWREAAAAACAKDGQKPKAHKPCCGDSVTNTEGRCAPAPCVPEDFFTTCDGKCGLVPNNCAQQIDCGVFCGECGECPSDTHICRPRPRGTPCGTPGNCCLQGLCSPDPSFCIG